jgi:hypothetical protein
MNFSAVKERVAQASAKAAMAAKNFKVSDCAVCSNQSANQPSSCRTQMKDIILNIMYD